MFFFVISQREQALVDLSRARDKYPSLGEAIWFTPGVLIVLLQELLIAYPRLENGLQYEETNRVCNAMALLQSVAVNDRTRDMFIESKIPMYLYPFLNTKHQSRTHEYLRLSSLGVIGALVRSDSHKVIDFLMRSEIIPLCLHIMEHGAELSITVATFILQKILQDPEGFAFMTSNPQRGSCILLVLSKVVERLGMGHVHESGRLLKHVLRCYMCLIEDLPTRNVLAQGFPVALTQLTIYQIACTDPTVRKWLEKLLREMGLSPPLEYVPFPILPVTPVMPSTPPNATADLNGLSLNIPPCSTAPMDPLHINLAGGLQTPIHGVGGIGPPNTGPLPPLAPLPQMPTPLYTPGQAVPEVSTYANFTSNFSNQFSPIFQYSRQ